MRVFYESQQKRSRDTVSVEVEKQHKSKYCNLCATHSSGLISGANSTGGGEEAIPWDCVWFLHQSGEIGANRIIFA
jgi:hypothetical protein